MREPKVYTYEVMGLVSPMMTFPFDMLRYDCAWPADPEAVSAIMGCVYMEERHTATIRLRSRQRPTVDRWRSFNWGCRELENA
jgi:hypothetical protein